MAVNVKLLMAKFSQKGEILGLKEEEKGEKIMDQISYQSADKSAAGISKIHGQLTKIPALKHNSRI